MDYHISRFTQLSFDKALERAKEELPKEGFGVLTEIDARATLKKKLNVDFRPYMILGACNPKFAYQAFLAEDKVGTLMPCNVVVQEHEDGRVEVSAMNPGLMAAVIDSPQLTGLARETAAALRRVIEAI